MASGIHYFKWLVHVSSFSFNELLSCGWSFLLRVSSEYALVSQNSLNSLPDWLRLYIPWRMKIEKMALIFHQLALVSSPERRRVNEVKLVAKEYSKMRHERRENIPVEERGGGRESNGFELLHDPSARRHSGGSERGRARFRFVNNE